MNFKQELMRNGRVIKEEIKYQIPPVEPCPTFAYYALEKLMKQMPEIIVMTSWCRYQVPKERLVIDGR